MTIINSQSHSQWDADVGVVVDPSSSLAMSCRKPSLLSIECALGGNGVLGLGRSPVEFGGWEVRI